MKMDAAQKKGSGICMGITAETRMRCSQVLFLGNGFRQGRHKEEKGGWGESCSNSVSLLSQETDGTLMFRRLRAFSSLSPGGFTALMFYSSVVVAGCNGGKNLNKTVASLKVILPMFFVL